MLREANRQRIFYDDEKARAEINKRIDGDNLVEIVEVLGLNRELVRRVSKEPSL